MVFVKIKIPIKKQWLMLCCMLSVTMLRAKAPADRAAGTGGTGDRTPARLGAGGGGYAVGARQCKLTKVWSQPTD